MNVELSPVDIKRLIEACDDQRRDYIDSMEQGCCRSIDDARKWIADVDALTDLVKRLRPYVKERRKKSATKG